MVAVQFDQDIKFYQGFHNPWYLGSRCGKGLKRLLTWKKASFLRPLGIYTIRACGILLNILFIFRAPFKLYCYIQFSEILEGPLWGVRESGGSHLNNWKVVSRTRISRKWLEIGNLAPHGSTHSPRKGFWIVSWYCCSILKQSFIQYFMIEDASLASSFYGTFERNRTIEECPVRSLKYYVLILISYLGAF